LILKLQDSYRNFHSYSLFILLLAMTLQSCESEQECSCPIERPTTSISGSSMDSTIQSFNIDGGLEVNVPNIKKLIEAKASLSGKFNDSDIQVEKTYWEVLGGDPQVIQNANLFWTIACAMYEIACEDPTITEERREAEKRQIVNEYKDKIIKILEPLPSIPDKVEKTTPAPPKKEERGITTIKKNAPRIIQVRLLVDAVFSDANFFANNEPVYPLPSSTLTVKSFEIDYKEQNVAIVAKSGKRECKKNFRIPSSYFDNPHTIQLTCSN